MTARVARLSPDAQEVLRAAAVGGRRVTHDRLAAVVALDEPALAEALREAQAANLVTVEPERRRYEFRHALLHEAVYRDVLPGERRRYHTSYAEQLTAERESARGPVGIEDLAELAHHWRGAGRRDEALAATLEAAAAAEAAYATPEAHRYYELALQLWEPDERTAPAVAPAAGRTTSARAAPTRIVAERPLRRDVLLRAADAASRTGAFARAVELVTTAIDELDADADPTAAGLLHERRAWFLWRAGREDAAVVEYRAAVRLVPTTPRTAARARVLAAYADALERGGTPDEARPWADEAVAIAREVDSPFDEGHARHALGVALEAAGDTDGALAELHLARELAERNGDVADVAGTYLHLWRILSEHGRGDEMVALGRHGGRPLPRRRARGRGPAPRLPGRGLPAPAGPLGRSRGPPPRRRRRRVGAARRRRPGRVRPARRRPGSAGRGRGAPRDRPGPRRPDPRRPHQRPPRPRPHRAGPLAGAAGGRGRRGRRRAAPDQRRRDAGPPLLARAAGGRRRRRAAAGDDRDVGRPARGRRARPAPRPPGGASTGPAGAAGLGGPRRGRIGGGRAGAAGGPSRSGPVGRGRSALGRARVPGPGGLLPLAPGRGRAVRRAPRPGAPPVAGGLAGRRGPRRGRAARGHRGRCGPGGGAPRGRGRGGGGRHGRPLRAHRPRAGGAGPGRRRPDEPPDRRAPVHQREDGQRARVAHPGQARRPLPGPGRGDGRHGGPGRPDSGRPTPRSDPPDAPGGRSDGPK